MGVTYYTEYKFHINIKLTLEDFAHSFKSLVLPNHQNIESLVFQKQQCILH